ncbi:carotenoid oxygenase family protein, partial [Aetokthonos hydrillicola]|uniref:carotenoid oxygenase family protein n=1 Tax=Aetokthonos hydrillicola TaxID=1550245 RepID=UPI001ABA39D0
MQIKSTTKAWAGAFGYTLGSGDRSQKITRPPKEFLPTQLQILSGQIPEGLRGTLYRNGSARLERGGIYVGHWFDGDGAILAVHFTDGGATGLYRFVQTKGYQEEAAAGKLLYGNYGMTAPGAIWNQWRRPVKNAANTSVLALPDKLLALWEGDKPYALDLQNLETLGQDDLEGLTDFANPVRKVYLL